ncbi:DUF2971 domain-containing protein [Pectobacterium polaris]|uniref:DUF2971 domain-containing protein n=1 Tax=Pectobacterium polaris TaxID=2042057 RepID=UPI001F2B3577|nr:DUF2971 domain-containing protein [Pectobacterium polaris]
MNKTDFYCKYISPKTLKYIFGFDEGETKGKVEGNRCLRISSPENFNDPFDCSVPKIRNKIDFIKDFSTAVAKKMDVGKKEVSNYFKMQNVNKEFNEVLESALNDIRVRWDDYAKDYRVLCLTKKTDNILMWSHYADSHKGAVLVFDFSDDIKFQSINKVGYNSLHSDIISSIVEKAIKNIISYLLNYEGGMDAAFKKGDELLENKKFNEILLQFVLRNLSPFFFEKRDVWAYEEEYRMVSSADEYPDELIEFNIGSLREVIFGVKASDETINNVIHGLKQFGFNGYVYKAEKIHGELITKSRQINYN